MNERDIQEQLQHVKRLESLLTRNNYEKDITIYNEILALYRSLAELHPRHYLPFVATTLRHKAFRHANLAQYALAKQHYHEALSLFRQLARKEPHVYDAEVANTLCRLAALHNSKNPHDKLQSSPQETEQELTEALGIYRRLAKKHPQRFTYKQEAAIILLQLATLHEKQQQYILTVEECTAALPLFRQLTQWQPTAYASSVAQTLLLLAATHEKLQLLDQAEQEYSEALYLYRSLLQKKPHLLQTVEETERHLTALRRQIHPSKKPLSALRRLLKRLFCK